MGKRRWMLAVLALVMTCFTSGGLASAEDFLSHQGRITDELGYPLIGDYRIDFAFYKTAEDGSPLASISQAVLFEDGYFAVDIPVAGKEVLDAIQNEATLYLEVSVRPEANLDEVMVFTRQRLTAAPFALVSRALGKDGLSIEIVNDNGKLHLGADSVVGQSIRSGEIVMRHLAPRAVGATQLDNGAVGRQHLANKAVTSAAIDDRAVQDGHIGANAVTGYHVADGSLTGADIRDESLRAQDMAPLGGVYAHKSAVYYQTNPVELSSTGCTVVSVSCRAPQDLPLQGTCEVPRTPLMTVHSTDMEPWGSETTAALFRCRVCYESGSGIATATAKIACVTKQ